MEKSGEHAIFEATAALIGADREQVGEPSPMTLVDCTFGPPVDIVTDFERGSRDRMDPEVRERLLERQRSIRRKRDRAAVNPDILDHRIG